MEEGPDEAAEPQRPQFLGHVERVLVGDRVLARDGDGLEVGEQRDGKRGGEDLLGCVFVVLSGHDRFFEAALLSL